MKNLKIGIDSDNQPFIQNSFDSYNLLEIYNILCYLLDNTYVDLIINSLSAKDQDKLKNMLVSRTVSVLQKTKLDNFIECITPIIDNRTNI